MSRLAFVLYWIATALLLRDYGKKLGKLKFWTIISLPLIAFLAASIFVGGPINIACFMTLY